MSVNTKPSVVFAHGLWADGSCFSKVIPTLQAQGHKVICSQHGLASLKSDVQCVTRCFGRVSGPVVLVGHSYGGTLITHAGMDDRVAALVYIAALAPDEAETSQSLQQKFPVTDVFSHIEVADGRIWLRRDGVAAFAGDLSEELILGSTRNLVAENTSLRGGAKAAPSSGACSSRDSVDFPATGEQSLRRAFSFPASTAITGSCRNWS
jgi:pimeloyl-ACP methyl ester carboxylesterase